jgi:hypothetical protein
LASMMFLLYEPIICRSSRSALVLQSVNTVFQRLSVALTAQRHFA